MKIIVDAFGGDNAPLEVIKGSRMAMDEFGVSVILTGDTEKIKQTAQQAEISLHGMELVHAPTVIPVDEDPAKILKEYRDCSMAVGLQLLAEEKGDAFVTAGSTGAFVMGSTFIVKRIKGIKRAALATVIPNAKSCHLLIDCGANHDVRPDMLVQFGLMGSAYMQSVLGVTDPTVGLANIGEEETKGQELQIEAYKLLKEAPLHFVGNVEARDIPLGKCDVVVCDGFTGNIILKLTEGLGSFFVKELKAALTSSFTSKMGAALVSGGLKEFKHKLDYTEYGGAPIMGIAKPVIKAHGSSNAKAFKNAIKQANLFAQNNVIAKIEEGLTKIKNAEKE